MEVVFDHIPLTNLFLRRVNSRAVLWHCELNCHLGPLALQAKEPVRVPASLYSASNPAFHSRSWEAAEGGQSVGVPAAHVGDPHEIPGFSLAPQWLLGGIWGMNHQLEALSLPWALPCL